MGFVWFALYSMQLTCNLLEVSQSLIFPSNKMIDFSVMLYLISVQKNLCASGYMAVFCAVSC